MTVDIRHGDCREIFGDLSGGATSPLWDVLICDPPYREHVHKAATSCGTPGARASASVKGAAHRDLGFDHLSPELRAWTCRAAARAARWSVIFTDTESVGLWQAGLEEAGAHYIRSIPWVRWSMPQLSGDRPPQGHEMVVIGWGSAPGKKSWNGPGNLTHFAHTCMRGDGKHKAQKPLDLMLDLVEFFSIPESFICDPFMGSGTTALAAAVLGRNFVGSEQSAEWVTKAQARLLKPTDDDEKRFARYEVAAAARVEDMKRMVENTARIRANREAQT